MGLFHDTKLELDQLVEIGCGALHIVSLIRRTASINLERRKISSPTRRSIPPTYVEKNVDEGSLFY